MKAINTSKYFIELRNVSKRFQISPERSFVALNEINLKIEAGRQLITIVGKSGSGKSTLLNLLAGLDKPSSGEISVGEKAIHKLSETELTVWRGQQIGIVFQFFQLLPTLTVLENILLAMDFVGIVSASDRKNRARILLETVEISDQA